MKADKSEKFEICVNLHDGRSISAKTLVRQFSADLYQTDVHYAVAAMLARSISSDSTIEPILNNLFSLKSNLVRQITATAYFVDNNSNQVADISYPRDLELIFNELLGDFRQLVVERGPSVLVSAVTVRTVIVKAILHRIFRLFSRRYARGRSVIRSWVEVSSSMFHAEARNSQFRVFPFPLSASRQWHFIMSLRRSASDWSLDGLPYSFRNILLLALASREGRAVAIAKLEHDAFSQYANELILGGVSTLYTSDEFEIGALVAGKSLSAANVPHVNSAHGVGLYCPKVAYGTFRYLTASQADFYRKHNPEMRLEARQAGAVLESSRRALPDDKAPLSIVYIHQNFGAGQEAEAAAQDQIIRAIASALPQFNASGVLKLHPNSLAEAERFRSENPDFSVMSDWDGLAGVRCIFVTINSTAYYEAIKVGPVLVYDGDSFFPSLYLDGNLLRFDLNSISARIEDLMPYAAWKNWRERAGVEMS